MAQYSFGVGNLFATPLSDAYGAQIAKPTSFELGILQDNSVDFSFDVKELYGQGQFPVDIARGKGKITGKAKVARLNGLLVNSILFGQAMSTGSATAVARSLTATPVPVGGTVTPTPPNAGVFVADLGVTNAKAVPLIRVKSAPAAGQYSVDESTGAYTFATADANLPVFINYRYSTTMAGAKSSTVMNLPMGEAPSFSLDLHKEYHGKILTLHLLKCVSTKMSLAGKQDDYDTPEFEFQAFADDLGRVFDWSISE
ncbi:hypothetical protein ABTC58_08630 [Acinetobacter baumannii]